MISVPLSLLRSELEVNQCERESECEQNATRYALHAPLLGITPYVEVLFVACREGHVNVFLSIRS